MNIFKSFAIATALTIAGGASAMAQYTMNMRPEFMGGYRTSDNLGNSGYIRSDMMGGYRIRGLDGSNTRITPDYMGGYRIRQSF